MLARSPRHRTHLFVPVDVRTLSRLAAFGLKVHDRVAGTLLAFATLVKKAIHVVALGSREGVFDAPDLLEHYVARLVCSDAVRHYLPLLKDAS
jgi:fructose-1,6-bisphosphatase/sedoheptulose 1,7-bisphosphatase-like protein